MSCVGERPLWSIQRKEGDQIIFIHTKFERWQAVRSRKASRRQVGVRSFHSRYKVHRSLIDSSKFILLNKFVCTNMVFIIIIKSFHKLHALGMNDDLWDKVCGLGNETWEGCECVDQSSMSKLLHS